MSKSVVMDFHSRRLLAETQRRSARLQREELSPLMHKCQELERIRPGAASVIEMMVDDLLAETKGRAG